MRNLKKLLAVIVSVCVLATFALPAFAAEQTAAEIVEDLGVLRGDSSEGVTDIYLAKGTSRMQAALLYLRLIGKEDEALAFEGEENFADAGDTWAAARPVLAYLKANPDLGWQGVSPDKFDPKAEISAQQMYKVCLEALGYKQDAEDGFKWADVFTFAADKGLSLIADVTELTNNDMATAIVEALKLTLKGSETTLIEDLVAKGIVTEAAAIAAGLIEATPEELEVASVTATNLIQAVVTFNQKVDNDTATDKDNYSFATADKIKIDNAALQDDGVSVVLTFESAVGQQKTAKLTVNNVKSAEGVAMAKTTVEVSFLDSTIPAVVDAEVIGVSTIKVTFSEPMKFDVDGETASAWAKYFKVNDGKFYVKSVGKQSNNTEFTVELYTSLKDGDLPFEVKVGPKDYAGFTAIGFSTTLKVFEDKEPPVVVSYKDAKPNSVTLIWSEDLKSDFSTALGNYYHTNEENKISKAPEVDGKEMKLTFSDNFKLPNGTAYVYVKKDAVKDYWNNKNVQQMVKLDVVADKDAPVLESIEVKAEDQIVLAFNEDVKEATAKKRVNYTFLDKDGKEIKNLFKNATVDGKKVTVNFNKKLDGGDYTLVVEDIEDLAGNEMSSTSMAFTITDKTPPVDTKFSAKLYTVGEGDAIDQIIKISFGEEMAIDGTYGIDDLAKYVFEDGDRIEKIDDVSIAVLDDGKAVEITIPKAKRTVAVDEWIDIARVADAAGNYTVALTNRVQVKGTGTVNIEKAEVTGVNEVKVYFSDELTKFEADEVIFTFDGANNKVTGATTELKDGKTVAIYTLEDELNYDATELGITTGTPADDHITGNSYGETLKKGALLNLTTDPALFDKLAPALAKIGDDDDDVTVEITGTEGSGDDLKYVSEIKLTFEEALSDDYLHFGSFEVSGFDVDSISYASNVVTILVKDGLRVEENTAITLKSPIRDMNGNVLDELDTSITKSLDADALKAEAEAIKTLAVVKGANTLPTVDGAFDIEVKSTSKATVYDLDGNGVEEGTANVVYTLTHILSGKTADTGTVVVTVSAD